MSSYGNHNNCTTINFSSIVWWQQFFAFIMIMINKYIVCRTFKRILTIMTIDWEKYSSTKFNMFATTCNVKLSQRIANMSVILYSTSIIFFSSNIFVKPVNDGTASNISTRLLILEMDLPFDINQRFVYESVIIVQFFHLLLCTNAVGLLNALLINLVSPCIKNIIILIL